MTYGQLWGASPDSWIGAGWALRKLAERIADRADDVASQMRLLGRAWSGAAGDAAVVCVGSIAETAAACGPPLLAADQALAEHASGVRRAKALLSAAVEATDGTLVTVDREGRVGVDWSGDPSSGDFAAAQRTAAGIRAAIELAARADAEAAMRLRELTAEVVGFGVAYASPPRSTDPAAVRSWWSGLDAAERAWLVVLRPDLVGTLDGIPAAARDQANRARLHAARATLLALLATLPSGSAATRIKDLLHGLDQLSARLDRPEGPRGYLVKLDVSGDGRTVVALGDPDRADHVLTYVPGTGATLDGIGGELTRLDRTLAHAAALAPTESTAAVLWLDYDAPDCVGEAVRARPAHDAGPALHRFVEGLRTAEHPAHLTVVGHSYGSLVVGTTAHDRGLAVDDLVFVGSPGVGVAHAADLGVPADHVWSSTARYDPIQYAAPSLRHAGRDLLLGALVPGYTVAAALTPDGDLWHGRNPSSADFGGRVFAADAGQPVWSAHSAYWNEGDTALDTIARIAVGRATQP